MKTNIIYLQMTALFLTAALQGALAAETPFKGSFHGLVFFDLIRVVETSDGGNTLRWIPTMALGTLELKTVIL